MTSWAIYIDIEGFSATYSNEGGKDRGRVFAGLHCLMDDIYSIGTKVCTERSKRLCAYQAGDAFFIDSEHGNPNIAIAIAIILMRRALLAGALTRTGISEGECVDVRGCRPEIIRRNAEVDYVPLAGTGHMRLFPVMGTAYINAHTMTKAKAKGCLLLLDSNMARRSSVESVAQSDPIVCSVVDWIHADIPEIHQIANAAGISLGNRDALETQLKEECEQASRFNGYEKWLANTLTLNHCE